MTNEPFEIGKLYEVISASDKDPTFTIDTRVVTKTGLPFINVPKGTMALCVSAQPNENGLMMFVTFVCLINGEPTEFISLNNTRLNTCLRAVDND